MKNDLKQSKGIIKMNLLDIDTMDVPTLLVALMAGMGLQFFDRFEDEVGWEPFFTSPITNAEMKLFLQIQSQACSTLCSKRPEMYHMLFHMFAQIDEKRIDNMMLSTMEHMIEKTEVFNENEYIKICNLFKKVREIIQALKNDKYRFTCFPFKDYVSVVRMPIK